MKTKFNKLFLTLLTTTLLMGGLSGCSMFPEGNYNPDDSTEGNTPANPDEGEGNNPSGTLTVKTINVNAPKSYICGETSNINNKFEVKATLSNDSEITLPYNTAKGNRWVFTSVFDDDLTRYDAIPETFKSVTTFDYKIKVIYDSKSYVSEQGYQLEVYGGSKTDIVPDDISFDVIKKNFNIGDTFDASNLNVEGYWKNMGGLDLVKHSSQEQGGYTFTCEGLNKQGVFTTPGKYKVVVNYRGVKRSDYIYVRPEPTHEKKTVNYNYENLSDDSYYEIDYMPAIGKPKTLIIPVWFDDSNQFFEANLKPILRERIETAYLGTKEDTGWHSVRTYYLEDSFGKLQIDGSVSPWFEPGLSSSDIDTSTKTGNLVKKAAAWYRNLLIEHGRGDEWTSFDTNSDGYLDAVILIYAVPNYSNSDVASIKNNENLWAYCFWVQDPSLRSVTNPGPNVFFWASVDFTFIYEGEQPEGSPLICDAHTYIHEMGHILGLEDYYDYANPQVANNPAGAYTMQDHNVGGHDPFSRLAYGWLNPYVPTTSTTITLNDFESSGDVIVLCPDWDGSPFNEYIIMDYWTPTGLNELDSTFQYQNRYPQGPKETGLRLWHVDARLRAIIGSEVGDLTTHPKNNECVELAMSNTTDDGTNETSGYVSMVPEDRDYDLLALLNASKKNSKRQYQFMDSFSSAHLWDVGDTFSMKEYACMFTNGQYLDSGKKLGYSINVKSKTDSTITVEIIKG